RHRTAPSLRNLLAGFGTLPSKSNFRMMLLDWRRYQQTHPQIFEGLDSQYFLDDWDIAMSGVLDQIDTLSPNNRQLSLLASRFRNPDLINANAEQAFPNPLELRSNIDQT